MRSFAPSARAVGSVAAIANPIPACPRNSRRVVICILSSKSDLKILIRKDVILSKAKDLQFQH
jgi:hypothetical protein